MYILSAKPLNGLGCRSLPSAAVICNTRMLKNGRQLENVPHMICPKDRQNGPKPGNLHITQVCNGDNCFEVESSVNKVEIPLYARLNRVEARFSMEHSSLDEIWFHRRPHINESSNLELVKTEYNRCQKQHQIEWNRIQHWHEEHNLEEEFGISKKEVLHAYFLAASTIFEPERSGERRAWVKSQIMCTILSTYYFLKQSEPSEQRIEFSSVFGVNVRVDPGMKGYKDVQRIITILFETLTQCKRDARERTGGDTGDDLLHEAWGGWLKKQGEVAEDREEIEVLVRMINICAGHMVSKEILSHIEYKALSSLTNKVCGHFQELQHKKMVETEENKTEKKDSSEMYSEIDKDMQSLLQMVIKDSSNIGISKGIKQTFLDVAKTFYYRAYFTAQQIENHIARVLFEQVV